MLFRPGLYSANIVASYQQQTEYLRNELPINIYNQVVGTQHRPNMNALQKFISKS